MADNIRCPVCGKENPASISVCRYCQSPLTPDSKLRLGDKPTKKNTGELDPLLPDWLKELQQQAKDSAEENAADVASMPKVQKAEPPDLLAGLASQSASADDEDVPDWLKSLSPKKEEKPVPPARPASELFASSAKNIPASKKEPEPSQAASIPPERDELSDWLTPKQPPEPFATEPDSRPLDLGWDFREETPAAPSQEAAPKPEEDLSWLHNLEAEAKKTGELGTPKKSEEWTSFEAPAGPDSTSQGDLSWLDDLGSLPAAEPSKPAPSEPGEDLSWLNAFTDASQPPQQTSPVSASSQDDLSWLDEMGTLPPAGKTASEARQPGDDLSWLNAFSETPAASQKEPLAPASSQDDLDWLSALDEVSPASQPVESKQEETSSDEDLNWLRNLPSSSEQLSDALTASETKAPEQTPELPKVPPFTPRRTAPLGEETDTSIPDWLKSATEEPSLPLGPQALDQMRDDKTNAGWAAGLAAASIFGSTDRAEETPAPPEPAFPAEASATLFNQDVDSIFSQDMPDWLAHAEPDTKEPPEEIGIHAESGETLSPAELPTWVQAMRPVEAAVITGIGPGVADQPIERVGPLAGLKGVIPIAAIGSLRRPQPIPLTLQASAEQQASAGILEEILLAETTPRAVASTSVMGSQRTLRWVIAGLLLFVLAAVIFSGTQIMPLPPAANDLTSVVLNIADNAPLLVVMDYQPSLAGEMEAVSEPVLNQLVQLRHPLLTFVSTAPSGNALVERLLKNTNISQSGGAGYIAGQNYNNLGYLPGGESGVLSFLQSQQSGYAAVLLLTDHAESARTWVEQLYTMKQSDPALAGQPLLAVSSAQAGPMLQPYVSSGQINGLVSGLPGAARYELLNSTRPSIARSYWDAFGVGMMMAVMLIVLGSLWSVYSGYRARSAETAKE